MTAYYIPALRRVYGTTDPETIAALYAAYVRELPAADAPGRYDGSIIFTSGRIRVLVGCIGSGTGRLTEAGQP